MDKKTQLTFAEKIARAEKASKQNDKQPVSEEQAQAAMARTTLNNLINDRKNLSK